MVGAIARDWVFGYGSLVLDLERLPAREPERGAHVAELPGYQRVWGVAMDNSEDVPGYKLYLAADGSRPAVWVAFLDLVEAPGQSVNGVLAPVTAAELDALDRRERNYDRLEVSEQIDVPYGRAYTYVGSAEGRARLAAGKRAGAAVIQRAYFDAVRQGFARLGPEQLARCEASTAPDGLPLLDLCRVALPPAAPEAGAPEAG